MNISLRGTRTKIVCRALKLFNSTESIVLNLQTWDVVNLGRILLFTTSSQDKRSYCFMFIRYGSTTLIT